MAHKFTARFPEVEGFLLTQENSAMVKEWLEEMGYHVGVEHHYINGEYRVKTLSWYGSPVISGDAGLKVISPDRWYVIKFPNGSVLAILRHEFETNYMSVFKPVIDDIMEGK